MRGILRRTRVRLTLISTGVVALVAVGGATLFWIALANSELGAIDSSLGSQATALAATLRGGGGIPSTSPRPPLPESREGVSIGAVLVDRTGSILNRSAEGPSDDAIRRLLTSPTAGDLTAVEHTVSLDGQRTRILVVRLEQPAGASLVLTHSLAEYENSLRDVSVLLAVTSVVVVITASVASYVLSGRALRPVRAMAATARSLSEHELHRRIDLGLPHDELGELASTFNNMLARLDAAFNSLQRFTADAAHELRAPMALLQTEVDVTLSRTRTVEEYQRTLRTVLGEVERLSRLADQLLLLVRADAGELQPTFQPLDVPDFVEEVAARWRAPAHAKTVDLVTELPSDGVVRGDPAMLRRLLDNLIDNAVRHSPIGGRVSVSAAFDGDWWWLAVDDNGPGVDPAIRPHLFERFTRSDPARSRATGGAGLGLSLCAAIAQAHGGTIELAERAEPGARFVVRLPRTPPSAETSAVASP